ncbi:MAG: hypothetical protein AAF517_09000 [Planctomycetota bacterium]
MVLLAVLWLIGIGVGLSVLLRFDYEAGAVGRIATTFPTRTRLEPAENGMTLVMSLHPRCPCSRASIAELERLLARCGESLQATLLFYVPSGFDAAWTDTPTWNRAREVPGVTTEADVDGRLIKRFGFQVSGEAALFDSKSQLRFHGGITPARSHEGTSEGALAVAGIVSGEREDYFEAPSFGCPVFSMTVDEHHE